MIRPLVVIVSLTIIAMILSLPGCDKEKIVESTEYVHDIQYVQQPADTIYHVDTVIIQDSVKNTDTVIVSDTIVQTNIIYDTTLVHDTVETVVNHYDTVVVTDTVPTVQCNPNEIFASDAMQYHCNSVILEAINAEFGYNDGWIFYLTNYQSYILQQSTNVYDLYGFIDYWTPEWDGFYAFEYYWRLTFLGGDPADPNNWNMTEPPNATATYLPGVTRTPDDTTRRRSLH